VPGVCYCAADAQAVGACCGKSAVLTHGNKGLEFTQHGLSINIFDGEINNISFFINFY